MRRLPLSAFVILIALILQLTIVNRLALPGGGVPDLPLVAVVALGLGGSPAAGAIAGFFAGLCLDVAPPGSFVVGQYALILCIVGYLSGELGRLVARSAFLAMAAAAAAAIAGEVMQAALGMLLRDPQVTLAAVRHVLPSSALQDAVAAPLALYLITVVSRLAGGIARVVVPGGPARPEPRSLLSQIRAAGSLRAGIASAPRVAPRAPSGLLGDGGWLAGPQSSPRIGDFLSGGNWIGGGPRTWRSPDRRSQARAPVRLRSWRGQPGSALAGPAPPPRARPGRAVRLRSWRGQPGSAIARPNGHLPQRAVRLRWRGHRGDGSLGSAAAAAAMSVRAAAMRSPGRTGPPGAAFTRSRRHSPASTPGSLSGGHGTGLSASRARFRPDPSLHGGSASGAVRRTALPRPVRPVRPARPRFVSRRRDGVVGGSVLAAGRPGRTRRQAAPRFRGKPAGGPGGTAGRARFTTVRQSRLRLGRSTLLSRWTGGRLGGRR
jgi:rod shape-determining protein MreD